MCMSCNDIAQIITIVTKTHLQPLPPTQPTNGFLLFRCSRCRMARAMWHNGRMTRDTARCEGILVICLFCFRILIRSMGLVYLPRWNPWFSWWMGIGKYTIPMHANGSLFDEQSPIAALKCFCCFVAPKFGENKLAWTMMFWIWKWIGWNQCLVDLKHLFLVGDFKHLLCSFTSPSKHLSEGRVGQNHFGSPSNIA